MDTSLIAMALARLTTGQAGRASLAAALLLRDGAPGALDALTRRSADQGWPQALEQASRDRYWLASVNGFVLVLGAPGYPQSLLAIPDPPAVLYGLGNAQAFDGMWIAIVGSRQGTDDGRAIATELATDFSAAGAGVVSGLARGIDAAAHRAALAAGGRTLAVLGAGVDRIYPPEHHGLAREICTAGAVISEFPPGTRPFPQHFPQRNRIISGLSAGVVLIEAGEKSGSLSTARHALEQGREVMVVPGSVRTARNRGGHQMIKQGAALIESAIDVLETLGLPVPIALTEPVAARRSVTEQGPEDVLGGAIFHALNDGPRTLNELTDCVSESVAAVSAALVMLEVLGFVRLNGQSYSRAP